MIKKLLIGFLLLSTFTGIAQTVPQTLIFKVSPAYKNICTSNGVSISTVQNFLTQHAETVMRKWPNHGIEIARNSNLVDLSLIYEVKLKNNVSVGKAVLFLQRYNEIEYAEPKPSYTVDYTPNDAEIGSQSYLSLINAYTAWDTQTGDTVNSIAIVDTGTDMDHPDLMDNMKVDGYEPIDGTDNDENGYIDDYIGWDFVDNDNEPQATLNDHGVHVAGLAAASTDNSIGVAGTGFNCPFLTVRVGEGSSIDYGYEGIVYAADKGAKIINCSWGGAGYSSYGYDIVRYATLNKDALVIAAAGNNGLEQDYYPAAYDYVFAVGSVNLDDTKSSFSNYGYWVDLMATGSSIYSTVDGGGYDVKTGTSMATPIVAGAAALLRAEYSELTAMQTGERLKQTADDISGSNATYQNKLGSGRLNMAAALNGLITEPSIVVSQTNFTDNNDDAYAIGDTIEFTATFTNYLATSGNLTAQLTIESSSNALYFTSALFNMGILETYSYTHNRSVPFQFIVSPNATVNDSVLLKLTISDGSYSTAYYYPILVNNDFVNINVNNLALTVASNSRIGYNDHDKTQGIGLKYNDEPSMLYEGGLMLGSIDSDTNVSDAIREYSTTTSLDFATVDRISEISTIGSEAIRFQATFVDSLTPADEQQLFVIQEAYAYTDEGHEDYVILEYKIVNQDVIAKQNLYAGLFMDFDINQYSANRTHTDYQRDMKFTNCSTDDQYAGVQLIYPSSFNPYGIDNVLGGNGGVNMFDGFFSNEKYRTLSEYRPGAGYAYNEGNDVAQVVSAQIGTLQPGDTAKVVFAVVAGTNLATIQAAADSAYKRYNGSIPMSVAESILDESILVYPNPTHDEVTVQNDSSPIQQVRWYDLQGKLIVEKNYSNHSTIHTKIPSNAKGLYILQVVTEQGVITKKIEKF